MSKLPLSPWNNLCWKDEQISFDIDKIRKIYAEVFSKYSRYIQSEYYNGIGFQGKNNADHLSAIMQGTLTGKKTGDVWDTFSPTAIAGHLWNQMNTLNISHKELCVGEFSKIIEYLESSGWHTFRARIMEVNPGNPECWHLDGYDGSIRYHVPIQTNEECYLQWRDDNGNISSFHLPADGSGYWINTDVVHHYINRGETMRAHIIVDLIKKDS